MFTASLRACRDIETKPHITIISIILALSSGYGRIRAFSRRMWLYTFSLFTIIYSLFFSTTVKPTRALRVTDVAITDKGGEAAVRTYSLFTTYFPARLERIRRSAEQRRLYCGLFGILLKIAVHGLSETLFCRRKER